MQRSTTANNEPKGTVFLDYDGTIHDSLRVYAPAVRTAVDWLVAEGHLESCELSDERIGAWLGQTARQMWTSFAPQLPEPVWQQAATLVGETIDRLTEQGEAVLFDGVLDALAQLKQDGWRLVFISNCRNAYCAAHRAVFGLDRYFDAYCTAEAFDGIPKWQIYQEVAGSHPLPHVMVGDRVYDIEVAVNSGIPSIGCAYGYGQPEELDQASTLVSNPAEIPAAVERLMR